jgi:hypothetical protein
LQAIGKHCLYQFYTYDCVNNICHDWLVAHYNFLFSTGKIPPRKPTTRRSPRIPKRKDAEVGEGSTPGAARDLDFSSKAEPIIFTSTKKEFSQPPTFGDTKESTGSKVVLPHWGDLFNRINQEDYPYFIPQRNPDVNMLDDQVFPNIRRSCLHMVAYQTPVFPCIETLGWIIDHTNVMKCIVNNENGECVGVFLPIEVQK